MVKIGILGQIIGEWVSNIGGMFGQLLGDGVKQIATLLFIDV